MRIPFVSVLGLWFACSCVGIGAVTAAEPPKILASGTTRLDVEKYPRGISQTIQNVEDLVKFLQEDDTARANIRLKLILGGQPIDFEKQTVLVLSAGPLDSGLLKMDVSALNVKVGELQVERQVTRMAQRVDPPEHPCRFVLIEKFEGPVKFAAPRESLR